ncbi:MAG: hypothetical protein KBS47_03295 [Bacteroidales bacterium]|nr:hypothetical protein [Candidatus Equimonas enterica]
MTHRKCEVTTADKAIEQYRVRAICFDRAHRKGVCKLHWGFALAVVERIGTLYDIIKRTVYAGAGTKQHETGDCDFDEKG